MNKLTTLMLLASISLLLAGSAWAVTDGLMDDFEDNSAMNWDEGNPSPNPPVNVGFGGPMGVDDNWLHIESTGGGGAGSKMAFFNRVQWAGDYQAAGVNYIALYANNFGNAPLDLRIGVTDGVTRYVSASSVTIPDNGFWNQYQFSLMDVHMTQVGGSSSLSAVLSSVTELRLISSSTAKWQGDAIVADLGVDDIEASSSAVANHAGTWGEVKALYGR